MLPPLEEGHLRLAVVQLQAIPQAMESGLWAPAEPRLARVLQDGSERFSVGRLFGDDPHSTVYDDVLAINERSVESRLRQVLDFLTANAVNLAVFPEYAIPVELLDVLVEYSMELAIVAGLGRIRNREAAARLCRGGDLSDADVVERNASVLVHNGRTFVNTKGYAATGEEVEVGEGPWARTLVFGERQVLTSVAVCLDFLRVEEIARSAKAQLVCVPARSRATKPFRPDKPRDHVRLLANAAEYGGSTIMVPGLIHHTFRDDLGVMPIKAGHEGIVVVDFDHFPQSPTGYRRPENALVLRAEIIERHSPQHLMLRELVALDEQQTEAAPVAALCERAPELFGDDLGPFAESVGRYLQLLRTRNNTNHAAKLAREHLVVDPGGRADDIREEQAAYVWQQLDMRSRAGTGEQLGRALDIYLTDRRPAPRARPDDPPFEYGDYIEKVIRPIRAGQELPPIKTRYAIAASMTDDRLITRVHEVVELWNRQRENAIPTIADAAERLLNEHVEFSLDGDIESAQRWRERLRFPVRPRMDPTPGPAPAVRAAGAVTDEPVPIITPARIPAPGDGDGDGGVVEVPAPKEEEPAAQMQTPPRPALAMAPPGDLQAQVTHNGIALRWSAPVDAPDGIRYVVTHVDLAQRHETAQTTWFDGEPPAGRKFRYRVTAVSPEGERHSHATTDQLLFAPPVTDYRWWMTRAGAVHAELRPPKQALEVEVRRTIDEPSADPAIGIQMDLNGNVFDDPAPPPGRVYYNLVPIYPGAHRGEPTAFAAHVIPTPDPPSLESITVASDASLTVRCHELPGDVSLMLMRVPQEPVGSIGDVLLPDELARFGTGVELIKADTRGCVTSPQPIGAATYVPFAVAGRRAVRGTAHQVAVIPPVTGLEAQRQGGVAMVSWSWPIGVKLVMVEVRVGEAEPVCHQITRMDFKQRGGFEWKRPDAGEIAVAGAVKVGAELLVGPLARTTVRPQLPAVYFTVTRPWWDWFGFARSRQVTICTSETCGDVRVTVYRHTPGASEDVELHVVHAPKIGPGDPVREAVQLRDEGVRRPYFIKVRAVTGKAELDVDWARCVGREVT
jgi:hypothetical protein